MVTTSLVRGGFQLQNKSSESVINTLVVRPVSDFGVLSVFLPFPAGETYVGDMPVVEGETNDEMWKRIMVNRGLSMRGCHR